MLGLRVSILWVNFFKLSLLYDQEETLATSERFKRELQLVL